MKHLEVAVAAPLYQTLTYAAPDTATSPLTPGIRLLVPLGRRLVTGYLLGTSQPASSTHSIKQIREILDDSPTFPENMVPFFRWIANYYHYPIGEVIKGGLPAGLTSQSSRWVELTPLGEGPLRGMKDTVEHGWLADLLDKQKLTPASTRKIWNSKHRRQLIEWSEKGWIRIYEEIARDTTKTKTETCIHLTKDAFAFTGKLKPSEQKTLHLLAELSPQPDKLLPRRDVVREYSGAGNALKGLEEKKLLTLVEHPVYRDPFGETLASPPKPQKLTPEQDAALHEIEPAIRAKKYSPFLLHGVTGSGKTEVYLRAAETTLAAKRSVLVLVPEIALATQVEAHFLSRFGDKVALLHSGLSKGERYDQWQKIVQNKAQVVIGARSAIFAPLENPGLIIVDEEHDSAYKQDDGLRYHARDLAVLRASLCNSTVILGSATPSLTSFSHADQGKYRKLVLEKRIENRPLPEVEIIDLQKVETVSGQPPLFSPTLFTAIRDNLANKQQTLIFLNRRGYANLMICEQCGKPVQCLHCHVSLTFHQKRNKLLCHYCGYTAPGAIICGNCQSPKMINIGYGTERIEAELTRLFPRANIARLDRDTTRKRNDFIHILKSVHNGEVDILVGTQMIAKGHHFPNVTLIGVVWADAGLGMPDFKAGERTYQLLSQVAGRAGRGEKPGKVIVQTHQPDHYSIKAARTHDFHGFFAKELATRQKLGFPPYSRLINLCFEALEEPVVQAAVQSLATAARKQNNQFKVAVLGPAPAMLSKLRGKYRWQLLLKGADIEKLHAFLGILLNNLPQSVRSNMVKMTVDVDPENMV
jgi:primosomal protein N' (replication factor Y)